MRESGCRTVKVKVAGSRETTEQDVARVAAVRRALGSDGRIRIDANGAWTVDEAERALARLGEFGLEYVEQPCASLREMAQLRRRVDVPLAVDEAIRKAPDPLHVDLVSEAADVLVVKSAPLGGVAAAGAVAARYGLPVVVSSALDTSVGLAGGLALAAALPGMPMACGLGTGRLLSGDVVRDPLVPLNGRLTVRRPAVDPDLLSSVRAPASVLAGWRQRVIAAWTALPPGIPTSTASTGGRT